MGNTDVMIEVDHMVMFYLMNIRRINLVRLILDYMISAIDDARRSDAAMPYDMFFTHVFARTQLPIDGHKKDKKCLVTTMKTFSAMGLKLQGPEKEGRRKRRRKKIRRKRIREKRRRQRKDKLLSRRLNPNLLKS